MIAVVELEALFDVVIASLIAGVGITGMSALVIFSATRAAELQRGGSWAGAGAMGLIAVVGLLVCIAVVVFGIQLMASKD